MAFLILNLLLESILDLGKCSNQKTHESESTGFLVWALPEVQNEFRKQFFNQVLYNFYSKQICGPFCLKKNGI